MILRNEKKSRHKRGESTTLKFNGNFLVPCFRQQPTIVRANTPSKYNNPKNHVY